MCKHFHLNNHLIDTVKGWEFVLRCDKCGKVFHIGAINLKEEHCPYKLEPIK